MGSSYSFSCGKCGYNQQLYEGWSFMVHDQSVEDFFDHSTVKLHHKTEQKIKRLALQKSGLHLRIEYQIYRCKICRKVFEKLFVQLTDDGRILHQTYFKCSNCKIKLKHTNIHRLKYAICPKCNSRDFTKGKELMLWN